MTALYDKDVSRHQSFHRRLLSEYNTDITLDNYVDYFNLKKLAKKIETVVAKLSGFKNAEAQKQMVRRSASTFFLAQESMDDVDEMASSMSKITIQQEQRRRSLMGHLSDGRYRLPNASPTQDAALLEERQKLQREFFAMLDVSFKTVCGYLVNMERKVELKMQEMRQLTEKMIKYHTNPHYLEDIYVQLQAIEQFRALNLTALQRLFHKFLLRCAHDSLSLQGEIAKMNERVEKSSLKHCSIDLRSFILELISVYGIVHRLTYETAIERLRQYETRMGASVVRIRAPTDTFFFNSNVLPMQKSAGSFAIKIFAGSTAQLMEKMLTAVLRCPRFVEHLGSKTCSLFPNGEVRLDLSQPVRGDDVFIVQSTVHSKADNVTMNGSLMELALMIHSAQLAGAQRITAVLPYIGYTRDTVSITAIAEIIEEMGCHHVITVDMDSEQVEGCFTIPMEIVSAKMEFVRFIANQLRSEGDDFTQITIVAPRDLYLRRAKEFADALMREARLHSESQFVSVCTAVRRQNTTLRPSPPPECGGVAAEGHYLPFPSTPQRSASGREAEGGSDAVDDAALSASPLFKDRNVTTSGIENALEMYEQGQRSIICSKKHGMDPDECEDDERSLENIGLVGDVRNRLCVIVDTMIDEAVDIAAVSRCLSRNGAKRILVVATHPIFSGRAVERLKNSPVELVIVSDSINQDEVLKDPALAKKLRVVPIAPLLALAIEKIHTEKREMDIYIYMNALQLITSSLLGFVVRKDLGSKYLHTVSFSAYWTSWWEKGQQIKRFTSNEVNLCANNDKKKMTISFPPGEMYGTAANVGYWGGPEEVMGWGRTCSFSCSFIFFLSPYHQCFIKYIYIYIYISSFTMKYLMYHPHIQQKEEEEEEQYNNIAFFILLLLLNLFTIASVQLFSLYIYIYISKEELVQSLTPLASFSANRFFNIYIYIYSAFCNSLGIIIRFIIIIIIISYKISLLHSFSSRRRRSFLYIYIYIIRGPTHTAKMPLAQPADTPVLSPTYTVASLLVVACAASLATLVAVAFLLTLLVWRFRLPLIHFLQRCEERAAPSTAKKPAPQQRQHAQPEADDAACPCATAARSRVLVVPERLDEQIPETLDEDPRRKTSEEVSSPHQHEEQQRVHEKATGVLSVSVSSSDGPVQQKEKARQGEAPTAHRLEVEAKQHTRSAERRPSPRQRSGCVAASASLRTRSPPQRPQQVQRAVAASPPSPMTSAFCPHGSTDRAALRHTSTSHFVIEDRIGRGAFSSVYRVRRRSDHRIFAMKCLPCRREEERAVAVREGEILTKIQDHENIIRIFDVLVRYETAADPPPSPSVEEKGPQEQNEGNAERPVLLLRRDGGTCTNSRRLTSPSHRQPQKPKPEKEEEEQQLDASFLYARSTTPPNPSAIAPVTPVTQSSGRSSRVYSARSHPAPLSVASSIASCPPPLSQKTGPRNSPLGVTEGRGAQDLLCHILSGSTLARSTQLQQPYKVGGVTVFPTGSYTALPSPATATAARLNSPRRAAPLHQLVYRVPSRPQPEKHEEEEEEDDDDDKSERRQRRRMGGISATGFTSKGGSSTPHTSTAQSDGGGSPSSESSMEQPWQPVRVGPKPLCIRVSPQQLLLGKENEGVRTFSGTVVSPDGLQKPHHHHKLPSHPALYWHRDTDYRGSIQCASYSFVMTSSPPVGDSSVPQAAEAVATAAAVVGERSADVKADVVPREGASAPLLGDSTEAPEELEMDSSAIQLSVSSSAMAAAMPIFSPQQSSTSSTAAAATAHERAPPPTGARGCSRVTTVNTIAASPLAPHLELYTTAELLELQAHKQKNLTGSGAATIPSPVSLPRPGSHGKAGPQHLEHYTTEQLLRLQEHKHRNLTSGGAAIAQAASPHPLLPSRGGHEGGGGRTTQFSSRGYVSTNVCPAPPTATLANGRPVEVSRPYSPQPYAYRRLLPPVTQRNGAGASSVPSASALLQQLESASASLVSSGGPTSSGVVTAATRSGAAVDSSRGGEGLGGSSGHAPSPNREDACTDTVGSTSSSKSLPLQPVHSPGGVRDVDEEEEDDDEEEDFEQPQQPVYSPLLLLQQPQQQCIRDTHIVPGRGAASAGVAGCMAGPRGGVVPSSSSTASTQSTSTNTLSRHRQPSAIVSPASRGVDRWGLAGPAHRVEGRKVQSEREQEPSGTEIGHPADDTASHDGGDTHTTTTTTSRRYGRSTDYGTEYEGGTLADGKHSLRLPFVPASAVVVERWGGGEEAGGSAAAYGEPLRRTHAPPGALRDQRSGTAAVKDAGEAEGGHRKSSVEDESDPQVGLIEDGRWRPPKCFARGATRDDAFVWSTAASSVTATTYKRDGTRQRGYLFLIMEHHAMGDLCRYVQQQERRRLSARENSISSSSSLEPAPVTARGVVKPVVALTEEQLLSITVQLASALAWLHRQDPPVIHRDVKAENILISGSPETLCRGRQSSEITARFIPIVLTDFGLAIRVERDTTSAPHRGGGTKPYMAPEVFESGATPASDVWSMVKLMYQESRQKGFAAMVLNDILQNYSLAFASLVTSLLVVDPRRRPTAEQVCSYFVKRNAVKAQDQKKGPSSPTAVPSSIASAAGDEEGEMVVEFDWTSPFFSNVLDL
eukprot:gene11360-7866_t